MLMQALCLLAATLAVAGSSETSPEASDLYALLYRLNWANHVVLSPEESDAQRELYSKLLERAAEGKPPESATVDRLKEALDRREQQAIDRLVREYRTRTYRAFRLKREELKRRREIAEDLLSRYQKAGQPAAARNQIIQWLFKAATNSTPGHVAPLPELPDLGSASLAEIERRQPSESGDSRQSREDAEPRTDTAAANRQTPARQPASDEPPAPESNVVAAKQDGPLPRIIRGARASTPSAAKPAPHDRRAGVNSLQPKRRENVPSQPGPSDARRTARTFSRSPLETPAESVASPPPPSAAEPRHGDGLVDSLQRLDGVVKKHRLVDRLVPKKQTAAPRGSNDLVGALRNLDVQLKKHGLPEKALRGAPAPAKPPRSLTGALRHLEGVVEQVVPPLAAVPEEASRPREPAPRGESSQPTTDTPTGSGDEPEPQPADRPRINLNELAARIAGSNLAVTRLHNEVGQLEPGDVDGLDELVGQFRKLAERRDDLTLYWNLLSPSQRTMVEPLQPVDPLVSSLGAEVFKSRRFVAGDRFRGTPAERQAALDRLDRVSQVLADTMAGR